MAAASLAASTTTIPMVSFLSACSRPIPSTADTVILLWMAGGMAHTETFDPKQEEVTEISFTFGNSNKRLPNFKEELGKMMEIHQA